MSHPFDRYRSLLDDPAAFFDALARPLPACLWTNTLRTTPEALAAHLAEDGLDPEPLAWLPTAFRVRADEGLGARLAYLAGLYQVQEEASLLPVALLDPTPGSRLLDLCAAPGNKTAQAAVALANRGTLVASDRSALRMRALNGTLIRLGLANTATTTADATAFPAPEASFDAVLADVPCTCEGTARKHPGVLGQCGEAESLRLAPLQTAILSEAVRLCRPGGHVVYSTCTFAPEENEAVLDAVLRRWAGALRVVPRLAGGLTLAPGVTRWQGRRYHADVEAALRLWPHANDTGGFFVAVLERLGEGTAAPPPRAPFAAPPEAPAALAALSDTFGLPEGFWDPFEVVAAGRRYWSLVPQGFAPPMGPSYDFVGLPFFSHRLRPPKLKTGAALLLAPQATRDVIDLDAAQARAFFLRRPLSLGREQLGDAPGYRLLRHGSMPLGVGWASPRDGALASLFPKAWARDVAG